MKQILLLSVTFLLLISCSQNENNTEPVIPDILLTSPLNNEVIGGIIEISAEYEVQRETYEVEFYCDDIYLGTINQSPFSLLWDTRTVEDGDHILSCILKTEDGESYSPDIIITVINTIFTITIEDSYVEDYDAFVLLTDPGGSCIEYKVFEQPETYEFLYNDSISYSNYVNVNYGTFGSDYRRIVTKNCIPVGEHWSLNGISIETNNQIEANFENVPDNEAHFFASSMSFELDNSTPLFAGIPYSTTGRIEYPQVYLGLDCTDGYKCMFWDEIPASPIDLSDLDYAVETNLQFPDYGSIIDYHFKGYLEETDYYSYIYLGKDYSLELRNELTLHNPVDKFALFNTCLTMHEDSGDIYYYSYYGGLVEEIAYYDADFEITEIGNATITISPVGIFDIIYSFWMDDNFTWWIYGPPDELTQSLPEFPTDLQNTLFMNSVDDYEMLSVSICDYSALESYEDYWRTLFDDSTIFSFIAEEFNIRIKYNPNKEHNYISAEFISPDEYGIK